MRTISVGLLAGCLLVPASMAGAATEAVLVGDGVNSDGRCLVLAGANSGATGRSRWATGYWERISTPAPVCSDTDPHFDPAIVCIATETVGAVGSEGYATIAYLATTGPQNASYLFKIVDEPQGVDSFGVSKAPRADGPCGAGAVETSPLVAGGFTITAA